MMNILYVCGTDPRELGFAGSTQRTHLLWKALNRIGNVYTICYYFQPERLDKNIISAKMQQPEGIKGFINKVVNNLWRLIDKDGPKILPFPWKFPDGQNFGNVRFDIVVSRYIEPAAMLQMWKIAPLYVDFDDHPLLAFKSRDSKALRLWQRPLAFKLLQYVYNRVSSNMTAGWLSNGSQISSDQHSKIYQLRNIPIVDTNNYHKDGVRDNFFFTVGYMKYSPNYLGVNKFIEDIWIAFHKEHPEYSYYIAGKGAPTEYADHWNSTPGVKYLGFVDDLNALYAKCFATIVPVYSGEGTCIKTLESLAFSRICFSTSFGARGMEKLMSERETGIVLYTDYDSFHKAFVDIDNDTNSRMVKEYNASQIIKDFYSEESFVKEVKNVIL